MTPPDIGAAVRRFAGPGGLTARRNVLLITARMTVTTDMCLGDGHEGDDADMAVATDFVTGRPIIPATSQTGALRAALSRVAAVSDADIEAVFGGGGLAAAFRPHDAVADHPVPASAVRDGIAVDPATATVMRGHLFSTEVVSAGTVFPLVWEVHLPVDPAPAISLVRVVAAAGQLLTAGAIRFGRRTHIGFGAVTAQSWRARYFDLAASSADVTAWYAPALADRRHLADEVPSTAGIADALTTALPADYPPPAPIDLAQRPILTVTVTLVNEEPHGQDWVDTPLLIGGAHTGLDNTTTYLRRPSYDPAGTLAMRPLDSGSTTLSLLRRTATRAMGWLTNELGNPGQGADLLGDLFGSHPADGTVSAARLRIDEGPFADSREVTMTSVAINPLAHTTVMGAFTQHTAILGGSRTVTIDVIAPLDTDIAILRLALADLVDGIAPTCGADTATGHGRRHATTINVHYQPPTGPARSWDNWTDFTADPYTADCHTRLIDLLRAHHD